MRDLRRNKQLVWYAVQLGTQELLDMEGNRTGQTTPIWGKERCYRLYVSASRGDAELTLFGQELAYDRVMSAADPHCPINERSVLWIERTPLDGSYDYVVVQRAVWKNSVAYAIRKVDIHENDLSRPESPGDQPGDS